MNFVYSLQHSAACSGLFFKGHILRNKEAVLSHLTQKAGKEKLDLCTTSATLHIKKWQNFVQKRVATEKLQKCTPRSLPLTMLLVLEKCAWAKFAWVKSRIMHVACWFIHSAYKSTYFCLQRLHPEIDIEHNLILISQYFWKWTNANPMKIIVDKSG